MSCIIVFSPFDGYTHIRSFSNSIFYIEHTVGSCIENVQLLWSRIPTNSNYSQVYVCYNEGKINAKRKIVTKVLLTWSKMHYHNGNSCFGRTAVPLLFQQNDFLLWNSTKWSHFECTYDFFQSALYVYVKWSVVKLLLHQNSLRRQRWQQFHGQKFIKSSCRRM